MASPFTNSNNFQGNQQVVKLQRPNLVPEDTSYTSHLHWGCQAKRRPPATVYPNFTPEILPRKAKPKNYLRGYFPFVHGLFGPFPPFLIFATALVAPCVPAPLSLPLTLSPQLTGESEKGLCSRVGRLSGGCASLCAPGLDCAVSRPPKSRGAAYRPVPYRRAKGGS